MIPADWCTLPGSNVTLVPKVHLWAVTRRATRLGARRPYGD
uniref:Uncharacterized protein n=1 Tax=Nonomuraea gerenzanensis TaxID=93944 RepID=A0A1M4E4F5_9ACTN|nr:hypothetical protein BN4615_P3187 [Nonomuraea gerenzanensis]